MPKRPPPKDHRNGPRDDGLPNTSPGLATSVQAAANAPQVNTNAFAPHEGKSLIAYLQAGTFTPEQVKVLRGEFGAILERSLVNYKAIANHDPAKLAEGEALLAAIYQATAALPPAGNPFQVP